MTNEWISFIIIGSGFGESPMGTNSSEGLVNDRLEVFGYPNMYVVDGSILQANPGVNPSFSITALAEYAMDQIPEKSGNKNIPLEEQLKVLAEV